MDTDGVTQVSRGKDTAGVTQVSGRLIQKVLHRWCYTGGWKVSHLLKCRRKKGVRRRTEVRSRAILTAHFIPLEQRLLNYNMWQIQGTNEAWEERGVTICNKIRQFSL